MSGLRQCKDILHVLKFGLAKKESHPAILWVKTHGKHGGGLVKMELNHVTCIFWARIIFHFIQSSGLL